MNSESKILSFEISIKMKLPDDYIYFLSNNELDYNDFEYLNMFIIQYMFDLTSEYSSLFYNYNVFKDRIPKNTISIGIDMGGNLILLNLSTSEIMFFEHETEHSLTIEKNIDEFVGKIKPTEY